MQAKMKRDIISAPRLSRIVPDQKLFLGQYEPESLGSPTVSRRFSRHLKSFSNKPLWSDVHHGVVTIAQHLGQGRLGPVALTGSTGGRVLGSCWGRLTRCSLAPCALLFQGLLEQA
jgi:hypothetical protein